MLGGHSKKTRCAIDNNTTGTFWFWLFLLPESAACFVTISLTGTCSATALCNFSPIIPRALFHDDCSYSEFDMDTDHERMLHVVDLWHYNESRSNNYTEKGNLYAWIIIGKRSMAIPILPTSERSNTTPVLCMVALSEKSKRTIGTVRIDENETILHESKFHDRPKKPKFRGLFNDEPLHAASSPEC